MSLDFLRAMRTSRDSTYSLWDHVARWKSTITGLVRSTPTGDSLWQKTSGKCCLVSSAALLLFILGVSSATLRSTYDYVDTTTQSNGYRESLPLHLRRRLTKCSSDDPCYFGLVADLDLKSKVSDGPLEFKSYLLIGTLTQRPDNKTYSIEFNPTAITLKGKYNEGGRGLELSELILFQKKLLMFDDRTGIIYEYLPSKTLVPRHVITAGNGEAAKGMKIEWVTEKDGQLWIGSFGKEYTDASGNSILSEDNFWIAILDPSGSVEYRNWKPIYQKLQRLVGVPFPGYLLHEAANWSDHLQKWVLLPRRVSHERYDEQKDEKRGSNLMILATEDFSDVKLLNVGEVVPERGFSSFKFVPGTQDRVILAIKSVEDSATDTQSSYVCVFETLTGKILVDDLLVPIKAKFEGAEFLTAEYLNL